ncbi:SDR family oxidoreductase [Inhella gelatinilytica]|uniref:SDR family oxidoreductase n=1 Tax=Inhella gelatinilytica TaxID=2795030 RepID=A0A931NBP2_9BURK|nr:SDR family oxidoreductase [Inhella gelatinilytica]MBH9553788.1 SDR family oxidoreductase [Inhella gelatinilytica]
MRVLIVGCGDVGQRLLHRIPSAVSVLALARRVESLAHCRRVGFRVHAGDLDDPRTLRRLAGWAEAVVHLAPPPPNGVRDTRTRNLIAALSVCQAPRAMVYVSTTGVYGDRAGAWTSESTPCSPQTDRARRRVDAETQLRAWARRRGVRLSILRAPGIYAADRDGHPRERVLSGKPLLRPEDDVYTNHIHADDLARACWRALWVAQPLRVFNVVDDSDRRMGEHFDLVADQFALPRPPRVGRDELAQSLSPMALSFLQESRRIGNERLKRELRFTLKFPLPEMGW